MGRCIHIEATRNFAIENIASQSNHHSSEVENSAIVDDGLDGLYDGLDDVLDDAL